MLRDKGDMAILLVEQYFDFAFELADRIAVLDRGRVVLSGKACDFVAEDVRSHIAI
jgi:urea transport system ATP-binding protein